MLSESLKIIVEDKDENENEDNDGEDDDGLSVGPWLGEGRKNVSDGVWYTDAEREEVSES